MTCLVSSPIGIISLYIHQRMLTLSLNVFGIINIDTDTPVEPKQNSPVLVRLQHNFLFKLFNMASCAIMVKRIQAFDKPEKAIAIDVQRFVNSYPQNDQFQRCPNVLLFNCNLLV